MSNGDNGELRVQVRLAKQIACKKNGRVINPTNPEWGGIDTDVDFIPKCECEEGTCGWDNGTI
jgi:hypothetical protein